MRTTAAKMILDSIFSFGFICFSSHFQTLSNVSKKSFHGDDDDDDNNDDDDDQEFSLAGPSSLRLPPFIKIRSGKIYHCPK